MAPNMASLLSQPSQATPPDAGPEQRQEFPGSVSGLMQASQQTGQPLSNEMVGSALAHMAEFQRKWKQVLDTPDIGKADIKKPFIEAVSQLMGGQFITLPQALSLMKTFPEDPLGQRQWVEDHYSKDKQASMMLLAQHAQRSPLNPGDFQEAMNAKMADMTGHIGRMKQIADHFKARKRG
jgi:hypothetical protein